MKAASLRWGLVLAAAAVATAAHAHDGKHGAADAGGPGARWDFTLPTLDGSRFVQASDINGQVLVNFWGRDCAPCVAELPRLQAFARDNPGWTVLLVATDPSAEANAFLQQRGIVQTATFTALRPGANVGGLMRGAGNRHGALPFSVALRAGTVCRTQLGEVSDAALAAWVNECGPAR